MFRLLPFFLCMWMLLALPWISACSAWVDRELSSRMNCGEKHVRIGREQSFTPCLFTPGERITVHLQNPARDDWAVVRFLSETDPENILASLETPVKNDGIEFALPEVPAPPGTFLQVQIQGKHVPEGVTGTFRIQMAAVWAAVVPGGHLRGGITDGGAFQRFFQRELPPDALSARILAAPGGRLWAAGRIAPDPSDGAGISLMLISSIDPWPAIVLPGTGGLDAAGFLPPPAPGADPIVVWTRQDENGWQVVYSQPEWGDAAVTESPINGLNLLTRPPRIRSSSRALLITLPPEDAPHGSPCFFAVSPERALSSISCADVFGTDIPMVPLDAVPGTASAQSLPVFLSCRSLTPEPEGTRIRIRQVFWDGSFHTDDALQPREFFSDALPGRWHLPVFEPDPQGPALLEPADPQGIWTLWDPEQNPTDLPLADTGGQTWEALFVDAQTLLMYMPVWDADAPAGSLQIRKPAHGWIPQHYPCRLRHVTPFSPRQLLLANPDQLIQSTLDDFLSGMPGTPVLNMTCDFVAIRPLYR